MKSSFLAGMLLLTAFSYLSAQTKACKSDVTINPNFSKAEALQSILKRYTNEGIPGATVAIYAETEGWWATAAGYAKVEDQTPMQICHLQYLQSVTKMYMAVAILQLQEKGKIKLDEPMTSYLPVKYSKNISNATQITVRMLLNHTSGVPEYNTHPTCVSQLIQYPLQRMSPEFMLQAIAKETPQFAPGAKHKYTNTNYLLLALIADAITGDHAAFIAKNIFMPLDLKNTFYRNDAKYLHYDNLVNSYWDVALTGKPANVSKMQQTNVASLIGDDGIVCTPTDAVKFLKGLMEGKLLKPASMAEMQKWVKDSKGNPTYGMGMYHFQLGSIIADGHGGGGIGAGCLLVYVPSHKLYVFMATNAGTVVDNPLAKKVDVMKNEILMALLM